MENPTPAPTREPLSLQTLQRLLAAGPPEAEALERLLADLERERRLEHAWLLLKQARREPGAWGGFQARLKAVMETTRGRRMSLWQHDPGRRQLRLRFQVLAPACAQHPAGLVALLGRTLMDAGLPLAMGLEKSPRPAVHLGHPLPLDVEGLCEWADAALLEPAGTPLQDLPERINAGAPDGLRVLECLQVPTYASPVAELCRRAHWRWCCPAELLDRARERVGAFLQAGRFEIERTARVGGQKASRLVDIRPLLEQCQWSGSGLQFQTRIAPGEAVNPRKLLAAILGLERPVAGLVRTLVELSEDPRLADAAKFEPKLHNMFEDATRLDGGGNIRLVEEDDDEPLRLG